jgi:hypothetical protein
LKRIAIYLAKQLTTMVVCRLETANHHQKAPPWTTETHSTTDNTKSIAYQMNELEQWLKERREESEWRQQFYEVLWQLLTSQSDKRCNKRQFDAVLWQLEQTHSKLDPSSDQLQAGKVPATKMPTNAATTTPTFGLIVRGHRFPDRKYCKFLQLAGRRTNLSTFCSHSKKTHCKGTNFMPHLDFIHGHGQQSRAEKFVRIRLRFQFQIRDRVYYSPNQPARFNCHEIS